jgi:hypothetical protein
MYDERQYSYAMHMLSPEHVYLLSSCGVIRIFVEDNTVTWRIEIITMSEATNADGNLFALAWQQ